MNTWTVEELGFDRDKIVDFGNKFMTGNGYMGYRGTVEEYRKEELVACNIAGLYDRVGEKWRETINAPNGMFTTTFVQDEEISLRKNSPLKHKQILDIQDGIHKRETSFKTGDGTLIIGAERFVSLAQPHLMCLKYTVSVENDSEITIKTGIDGDVWDINGPHLEGHLLESKGDILKVSARTHELKIPVVVCEKLCVGFQCDTSLSTEDKGIYRLLKFNAQANREYTIYKYVWIHTGNDVSENIHVDSEEFVESAYKKGYCKLLEEHRESWSRRWETSDVIIEGDEDDQLALRYSMYHLHIIAPAHSDKLSIPARGLSGQTYKGAVFWDTEIFMLPFFLHTSPEVARNLVNYRIRTLDGAREKAKYYGYKGAFYAWESHENGEDACSDFNVTDVFTGRPVKTYFRDKQVHISAAVAYAIWETYNFTGDKDVLLNGGAEVILECARFFYSYAYYKEDRDRYEILDVIGPDEYHERVNNNAYTNKMVGHTLEVALKTLKLLKEENEKEYIELIERLEYRDEIENLRRFREKLYVPEPDENTMIIEQFDGYNRLEDCSLEQVKSRLLDPKEYWGGGHGVASQTQILKQADVALMLYMFRNEYSKDIKKANWEHYEVRTEHGSSLSPCTYALLSCEIDNPEWAYPFFVKTANVDLTGKTKQFAGSIYIGGTHPAANGGAWMSVVQGFAGLKVQDGNVSIKANLPKKWNRLTFNVVIRGDRYRIDITHDDGCIIKTK